MTKGPTLGLQAERAWRAWRARRARYGRVAGSAAGVHGAIFSGHGRGGGNVPWRRAAAGCKKSPATKATEKAADKAALAAFLLNKYGPGGSSKLAATEAATSTDEQVVREGQ